MNVSQQLAADAIQQVFAGRNLNATLEILFRQHAAATPQQRAVAQDLSYGTLRFYGPVQAMLAQLLEKPLQDESLRCLLLVAIYQLQYDKAASHTVVDQAVKAASRSKKSWAKGLVNGVLRNFLRQQAVLVQTLGDNEVATYSYPSWWINKLRQQYLQDWQAMLSAGNVHPPMTLRVNRRRHTVDEYRQILSLSGIASKPLGEHALMLDKALPVDKIPGFFDGDVSVQDYGAQLAAELLDIHDDMRVLDACCAPGGKTGHLLELADIDLTAMDSDATRLQRTGDNLQRLMLQANLVVGDAAGDDWWDGVAFDRILADVPCTASGIVRRHVDIKWLRREADIASFTRQQAAILPSLWRLLAKGGKLLYVTCSVFHEENQRQVDNFLNVQADAEQLPLASLKSATSDLDISDKAVWDKVTRDTTTENHGQLLPCAEYDGFFYALLQKN